ncbi:YicC/YloC family endoribonuclease [Ottowia flava]|uniref:YicC/YloC family endoribonuclease n=2 Tax=Comamonadaceae TaxID=80864 RepID=A0ABW4KSM9_9BURK
MTGFASGQQAVATAPTEGAPWKGAAPRIAVELRSVNSRFLDLSFRLPDELRAHEPALRELLTRQLKRGKVELRAYVEGRDEGALADPPPRVLQRMASLQDQVMAWLPDVRPLSVADVLRLSGGGQSNTAEGLGDTLLALAQQVLTDFMAARAREGVRLTELLLARLTELRRLAAEAQPLVPQVVQAQKERFLTRWNEALAGADAKVTPEAGQERALAEATAFAIRIDVAEELGRLAAHLDEIESVLKKGGDIGKRLDFLIQELHREANTLGSKSAALEMRRISVDMKVLIEQMREQVQNIE